jgi:hypothetical protein
LAGIGAVGGMIAGGSGRVHDIAGAAGIARRSSSAAECIRVVILLAASSALSLEENARSVRDQNSAEIAASVTESEWFSATTELPI